MGDRRYAVVFGGELIEGVTPAGVRERLTRMSDQFSPAQVSALVAARNASLRLFETRETADRFVGLMREAGMVCWLKLLRPGEDASALLDEISSRSEDGVPVVDAPPPPKAVRSAGGPPRALAAAAVVVLAVGAGVFWFNSSHSRSRLSESAAQIANASQLTVESPPVPAASEPSVPAPVQASSRDPGVSKVSYIVPEPVLTMQSSRPRADAPADAPQAASGPSLKAPPVTYAPATAPATANAAPVQSPPQMVAMNHPAVPAPVPASAGAAAELVTAPTYDRAKVTQPRYPVQAFRNREQGEVLLNVVVGADGKPRHVSVDKSSGSVVLDRAALETVKGWQFTPGTRNGVAREAARQVAVGFKLDE